MKSKDQIPPSRRSARLNRLFREEINGLLRYELHNDEVTKMLTITTVDVSNDLAYAKIYFTILDKSQERISEVSNLLKGKAGKLRGVLGRNLHLKRIPRLTFLYDETEDKAADLENVLRKLKEERTDD